MAKIIIKPREIINNTIPIKCGDWLLVNSIHLCVVTQIASWKYSLVHITASTANRFTDSPVESSTGKIAFSESEIKKLTDGLPYEKVEVELIITLPPRYK